MSKRTERWWVVVAALVLLAAVVIPRLNSTPDDVSQVVVYCAHDAVFADAILDQFRKETGIEVQVRYDEEASKSLGLSNLLIAEKDDPRCDVYWNNQTLGTIRLKEHGVLEPYRGPGYERIPARYRDPEGHWTGFAARLRVYLVATDAVPPELDAIHQRLDEPDLSRVAIAKPLFGTTLTHYSVHAAESGIEDLQQWHQSLRSRGVREVRGNASARDLVVEGICDLCFTDTDDAFAAVDRDESVAMVPVRTAGNKTICIPNSVAMIKGCRNRESAERLIEYLLSRDVEVRLANSSSRQIPLGEVNPEEIPEEVRALLPAAEEGFELSAAVEVHTDVLDWLSAEYHP